MVVLGLCSSILLLLQAHLMADCIGSLFLHVPKHRNLVVMVGELAVVFLVRSLVGAIAGFVAARFAANAKLDIRARWLSKLFTLSPLNIERMQTGELVTAAVSGIDNLESYLARYLPQSVEAVMVPVVLLINIFQLDWISATLLCIAAPLIVFFMILLGKGADSMAKKQWHLLENLSANFLELIEGLLTLKLFSRSADAKRLLAHIGDANRVATMKTLRVAFLSSFVLELFATLGTGAVALALGLRLLHADLAFIPALTVLLLAPEFFQPIRALGTEFHAGLNGLAAAESLFAMLDEREDGADVPIPVVSFSEVQAIRFVDVCVRYPGQREDSLQELCLTIHRGEKIAVTGPSGSGKTTFLQLLSGTLSPSSGVIEVDGQSCSTLSCAAWRNNVTLLNQAPYIFSGTLRENLQMALPGGDTMADNALQEALLKAGLRDWLRSLPGGLDTRIGDGGRQVSGGEAQRIAIARAWLRQSPFLLLDEPTANLDPLTAAEIETAITALTENRTVVVVTHDPGFSRRMDRVIRLAGADSSDEEGTRCKDGTGY